MIDIPGRDGSIDLTDALGVHFEDRFLYITLTDLDYKLSVGEAFARLQREIAGRRVKVILDKEPAYYFVGRVIEFSQPEVSGIAGTTTITIEIDPYRYSIYDADNPWLWDPFNFLTDMATDAGEYRVNGTLSLKINVGQNTITPTIEVSSDMTLELNGKSFELHTGVNRNFDIRLIGDQENTLIFRGNGTVVIDYSGGRF